MNKDQEVMNQIDTLMSKGSNKVTKRELSEIRKLSLAAKHYEQNKFEIEGHTTPSGIIEMKMYEMRLVQKELPEN